MRQALESNYVSNHLHEWIDLIFGYKQQGKYAIEYDNLFYYLTYEGAVDFSSIPKDQHESILVQIYEFGQTPKQLFRKPHPCRKIIQEQDKGSPLVKLKSSPIKEVNINEDDKMFKLDFGTEIIKESSFWDPKLSLTTRRGVINISSTKVHRFPINDICLSSDSKTLYAVGKDSSLSFISLEDKENPSVLRRIKLGKLSLSCCELFKHDDNHLIIGSWDNCLYLYSINYGRIVQKINGHDDAVSCIEQGDNLLVTGSWDSSIKVWDIEKSINLSQEPINAFYDHNQEISCLSLQNSLLISGGKDNMVYLNDLRVKNMNTAILKLNAENVKQVKFVSDRKVLICTDNGIKLFDVSSKELTSKLEFNDNTIINGFVTDNKSIILNTSAENRLTYGKVYGLSEIMDEQLTGKANPVSLNKVEENEFTKMIASPKGDLIVNSYKNGMFSILY
jgi:factor associated with neutral sphingomyelinase activation